MKRKTLWLTVALLCLSATISAQTVQFGYDESGNRTSRDIVLAKSGDVTSAGSTDKDLREQYYVDLFSDVKVTISPNPNGGKFSIKVENIDLNAGNTPPIQLLLLSISGEVIYRADELQHFNEVDISQRQNGTYILTLISGSEKRIWKVIKQ